MCPANSAFEHPAAPNWGSVRRRHVVNRLRSGQAPDPPGLDVDDAAGTHFERLPGVFWRVDRFVETDGSAYLSLELRVVPHVVVRERLLDHHEIELIEFFEKRMSSRLYAEFASIMRGCQETALGSQPRHRNPSPA